MPASGHSQNETSLVENMWEVLGEESRQLWLQLRSEGCTAHGAAGRPRNCSCQGPCACARPSAKAAMCLWHPPCGTQNVSPRHSFTCPSNAFGVIWKDFYIAFFYLNSKQPSISGHTDYFSEGKMLGLLG